MLHFCTCCEIPYVVQLERGGASAYCDRCEVAYLQFKLNLLVAVCRSALKADRNADEV
jgi:hypothetical protein